MTKLPILVASVLCLSLVAYVAPAAAETAHNAEFQTKTKNSADQGRHMHKRMHMHHKKMM